MKFERLDRRWPGSALTYAFGPRLNIVVLRNQDADLFDAAITALCGPPRRYLPFKKATQATDEFELGLQLEQSDGRRLRVSREMTSRPGHLKIFDVDTAEQLLGFSREDQADLLAAPGRNRFEALARVRRSELWTVASMGRGLEQVLRKNALAAGATASIQSIADRALAAMSGNDIGKSQFSTKTLIWARAREVDLGKQLSAARAQHAEAASARAALRRCQAATQEARAKAEQARYFALVADHSNLVALVAKLRSLEEEIRRLTPAPLPLSASRALELAPEIDRLVGRIATLERQVYEERAKVPEPPKEILEIEAEIAKLEDEIEADDLLPADAEPDPIIQRAYEDWRRLCGETEAAEFAAAMARADAAEIARPSPGVARLAKVTTADRLRSRLAARTAALREKDAAERRREAVLYEIKKLGLDVGSLLDETFLLRKPISLLAEVEEAHNACEQAEKELDTIRIFQFGRRRKLSKHLTAARKRKAALLVQVDCRDYQSFRAAFDRGCALIGLAVELTNATTALACATAELRKADDEVAKHASGAGASKAAELVGALEKHQNEVAAAEEIRKEAQLAASTAASLRASRDTAAKELLARLRRYGIRESDPARAWSTYKLTCARGRKRNETITKIQQLRQALEPYREIYCSLIAARAALRDEKRRLCAHLVEIPECASGSYAERLGNFTRIRDEALLEQKLEQARRQVADEYEKILAGKTRAEWEARLISTESRLSEIEERHPEWKEIQITGSAALLVKAADEAEAHLTRVEADERAARARVESNIESLPDISRLNAELARVRGDLAHLEHLRTRIKQLPIAISEAASEHGDRQIWKVLPANAPKIEYSEDPNFEMEMVSLDGSVALELAPPQRANRARRVLDDYLTARFALMIGWGPTDEHIPLLVEDIFGSASRADCRDLLDLLSEMATMTQVIVATPRGEIAELAEALDPETTRIIKEVVDTRAAIQN